MLKFALLLVSMFLSPLQAEEYKIVENKNISDESYEKRIENELFLKKEKGNYFLKQKEKEVKLDINTQDFEIVTLGEYIYVIILENGELSKLIYDNRLNYIKSDVIIRDGTENFKVEKSFDKIIIVGGTNERNELTSENKGLRGIDGFVFCFNNEKSDIRFFGGLTDERIIDCLIINDNIYVCGYKSPLGEGDFGNGGKYENSVFISKLNKDCEVEKAIVLNENNNIKSFISYGDSMFLLTDKSVYKIDESLKIDYKNKYNETIVSGVINEIGIMTIAFENKLIIKDYHVNKYIEIPIDGKVVEVRDSIKVNSGGENKIIDVILLYRYKNKLAKKYKDELAPIYSLFGKCEVLESKYSPVLNMQVYGEYDYTLNIMTKGKIETKIKTKYVIDKEANVRNGGIYPVGYRLRFTGKGFLNGNKIIDNYQISTPGEYTLELVGVGDERYSLSFSVSSSQIEFSEEMNKNSDSEMFFSDKPVIRYKVKFSENININYVIVNGNKIDDVYYDNVIATLFIPVGDIEETGKHIYNIERVYYNIDNSVYYEDINELYTINILNDDVSVNVDEIDKSGIVFSCVDINACLRWFKIIARNKKEEKVFTFPVDSQNLLIKNLEKGTDYYFDVYIVSDIGGKNLSETLLFSMFLMEAEESVDFGKLNILKFERSLEKFSFEFGKELVKNNMRSIKVNDKIVFENQSFDSNKYVFFLAITFFVSCFLTVICKMYKRVEKK